MDLTFLEFRNVQDVHIHKMLKDNPVLYVVDSNKDDLWELYLSSFPEGTNVVFRERDEFDCSCCRHYIKNFGSTVTIKDGKITSIWDFKVKDPKYQAVISALSKYIHSLPVKDLFITKDRIFGTDKNLETLDDGKILTWHHFYTILPKALVYTGHDTVPTVVGEHRAVKETFQRSLKEISKDSIELVLDMISQNSLYKGDEWKTSLETFMKYQEEFEDVAEANEEIYCWENAIKVGPALSRLRTSSIGTLLVDLTNEVELNVAVKKYYDKVDPSKFKRSQSFYSKKMVEDAKAKIIELGLEDSLGRRFATIGDISIKDILFANSESRKLMSTFDSIFDDMGKDVKSKLPNLDKVDEVNIETFIADILPNITGMEVLFEPKHQKNLVSLITSKVNGSKSLFKWNNPFCHAYNGNMTDSSMKERVRSKGGDVEGILRFSIQWNENRDNEDDLDAHCREPIGGRLIYFQNRGRRHPSSGMLDVDIVTPDDKTAVENISYVDYNKMPIGKYKFLVHCYTSRGNRTTSGFTAELEFNGQIYEFEYASALKQDDKIEVAVVELTKDRELKLIKSLDSKLSVKKVWNINTNVFHKVNVMMHSPNFWDSGNSQGNKHYMFMLENCINDETPNGFFNEYLNQEFHPYRKFFEALGSKMKVADSEDQLSGLGFSSTQRNAVVLKLEGKFNRTIKLTF